MALVNETSRSDTSGCPRSQPKKFDLVVTKTYAASETEDGADANAVRRLAGGEMRALDELVTRHHVRLGRLAHRLLGWGEVTDAEDVVQDVFLIVLRHAGRFDGRSRVSTWLTTITVNRCRSLRRRAMVRLRALALQACSWVTEHQPLHCASVDSDEAVRVRQAVARLRPRDREVIVLRYLDETSVGEIAAVLGLSRSAVEVRLHRARERLRELIGSD